jgi:hypothetical protein
MKLYTSFKQKPPPNHLLAVEALLLVIGLALEPESIQGFEFPGLVLTVLAFWGLNLTAGKDSKELIQVSVGSFLAILCLGQSIL